MPQDAQAQHTSQDQKVHVTQDRELQSLLIKKGLKAKVKEYHSDRGFGFAEVKTMMKANNGRGVFFHLYNGVFFMKDEYGEVIATTVRSRSVKPGNHISLVVEDTEKGVAAAIWQPMVIDRSNYIESCRDPNDNETNELNEHRKLITSYDAAQSAPAYKPKHSGHSNSGRYGSVNENDKVVSNPYMKQEKDRVKKKKKKCVLCDEPSDTLVCQSCEAERDSDN